VCQVFVMTCDLTETLMLQIQDSGSASSEPLRLNFVDVFRLSVERKTSHKRKNTAFMSLQPRLLFDTVKPS
jgi:hypothetical protein